MRKDIRGNKVIKAIALGLATSMLMAQPLSASAQEAGEPMPGDGTNPNPEENKDVATDSAFEAAEDAIETAQDAIVAAEEAAVEPEGEVIEPEGEDEGSEEGTTALQDAGEAMKSAEANILATDGAQNAADADVEEAKDILEDISENNTEIITQGEAADDAVAKAEEALQEAKDATNKEDAQAAVDKADEAVQEAQAAQEAAQAAYDENTEKLVAAQTELEAAKANLEAAQNSLDATKEEVEAAEKLLAVAEKEAAELEAQVAENKTALEQSKENALKTAYDKMVAERITKIYTGESATAPDENGDGIGDEFTDGFGQESANSGYWKAADEYFELYLKYVYGDSYQSGSWTKTKTVDNDMSYVAAVDNTFTVTYIDEDGNEQTAYYNYHTSTDPEKQGEITIYEKQKATGMTEEVWETQTEEFEDTRIVTETYVEQEERTTTTYEDVLSIESTDEDGNSTYIKLSDVQKDSDVVLTTGTDEKGNTTSVLVKDDSSQLMGAEETAFGENQEILEGTSADTYTVETIQVPASYGTKEEEVEWEDKISTVDELKRAYNKYAQQYSEEGYTIRVYIDHAGGDIEEITIDSAMDFDKQLESFFFGWLDKGYEIGVFQTVEDKENVTEWTQQQVIVKTTTASVATTTYNEMTVVGHAGDRKEAEAEAKERAAQLGLKEGEYTVSYVEYWEKWLDWDYEYTITYYVPETTTTTETVSKETYSATSYGMNTISTTTTWMEDVTKTREVEEKFTNTREVDVLIKEAEEFEYWTERRNTSQDATVAKAIDEVEAKLQEVFNKQSEAQAAADAVDAAAKAVAEAKAELEKISVSSAEYDAALQAYETAVVNQEEAVKVLEEIEQEVEKAQDTYKDAAAQLGRFVPGPSNNPVEEDNQDEPEEEPEAEQEAEPEVEPDNEPEIEPEADLEEEPAETPDAEEEPVDEVVEIEDEETPLAQGTDAAEEETGDDSETEVVEIEDEETPLAMGSADVKEGPMNWWWLLIVAALGATGYEMYRRHNAKKAEKEVADK